MSALLVVFSFWFWSLLKKRVIQKTLGTCLDEIGYKGLDRSVDHSCSLFLPHTQFFR